MKRHLAGRQAAGAVIPPKHNRKEQRDNDEYVYRLRHVMENVFLVIKRCGMTTRYTNKTASFSRRCPYRCIAI